MTRAVRTVLIALLLSVAVLVMAHNLWRAFVLDIGIWFLCWGLFGPWVRRSSTPVGCVIAGFGVGMFSRHPIVGAMLGAVIALVVLGRFPTRRDRLKETT